MLCCVREWHVGVVCIKKEDYIKAPLLSRQCLEQSSCRRASASRSRDDRLHQPKVEPRFLVRHGF